MMVIILLLRVVLLPIVARVVPILLEVVIVVHGVLHVARAISVIRIALATSSTMVIIVRVWTLMLIAIPTVTLAHLVPIIVEVLLLLRRVLLVGWLEASRTRLVVGLEIASSRIVWPIELVWIALTLATRRSASTVQLLRVA